MNASTIVNSRKNWNMKLLESSESMKRLEKMELI